MNQYDRKHSEAYCGIFAGVQKRQPSTSYFTTKLQCLGCCGTRKISSHPGNTSESPWQGNKLKRFQLVARLVPMFVKIVNPKRKLISKWNEHGLTYPCPAMQSPDAARGASSIVKHTRKMFSTMSQWNFSGKSVSKPITTAFSKIRPQGFLFCGSTCLLIHVINVQYIIEKYMAQSKYWFIYGHFPLDPFGICAAFSFGTQIALIRAIPGRWQSADTAAI